MPPKKQRKSRKVVEKDVSEADFVLQDSPSGFRLDAFSSTTFQTRRQKLYEEARDSAKNLVATHVQLLQQARAHILDMKSQEVDAGHFLKEHIRQQSRQNDAYKEWHKSSGTFVAQLGQQRSSMIDETSKTLNMAATERNSTCRQFSKEARMQVEKSKEEEKLATDASSLIRHYKSLLIGTHDKKGRERKWG
ncbi:hypothetical protein Agabi119p4_2909 [Agaricus bisporus var. burnettii]|uniref:Uncharacterized protein n=1 Tax=Agaricus bisporus var. burnettii TaxID=192524 RepID=A0A8H7F678_AGABI|nr:hypothetical protein Agabi119p4_2909 [Agaricus bisporus var. burnettii]